MTTGQQRAIRELQRLAAASRSGIEIVSEPVEQDGKVRTVISIQIGPVESRPGGLEFREREEFHLTIPADFPFDYPRLWVEHDRFAGFAHVIWSHGICLYRQLSDWNPRGGMYGFFEQLRQWLARAAMNDMDPADIPLEPPHHVTASAQLPFVIRANAPVAPGTEWIGFAHVTNFANRRELVAWSELADGWPTETNPALAVMLPKALPLEFPQSGADFFAELDKQGVDRDRVLRYLTMAAILADKGEPLHVVFGFPMRRSADGAPLLHIAVWTMSTEFAKSLRLCIERETDSISLQECRRELLDSVYGLMEVGQAVFCRVLEDRPEVVTARDQGSAVSWFANKRLLLIGCGALGSWLAEMIARAGAARIHLVDNAIVKPGVLRRQNYRLDDIARNKAEALKDRLQSLCPEGRIEHTAGEAHDFMTSEAAIVNSFDVVIDCTASSNFQMKLERDWKVFAGETPPMISLGIDAEAKRGIAVVVPKNAAGGIWDAYLQLQRQLCVAGTNREILDAFYSGKSDQFLFQPEPGCSEPTFVGSTADVMSLASTAINIASREIESSSPTGIAYSMPSGKSERLQVDVLPLDVLREIEVGHYRVRIATSVIREARGWVQSNNRLRSPQHETGGIVWGLWDDAVGIVWLLDASGPPDDSKHEPGRFVCGVSGTAEEHQRRRTHTRGLTGFVGMWHTHPGMPPQQSVVDIGGMSAMVSSVGQNQRRALMLIFGRDRSNTVAGLYIYESEGLTGKAVDLVSLAEGKFTLDESFL